MKLMETLNEETPIPLWLIIFTVFNLLMNLYFVWS